MIRFIILISLMLDLGALEQPKSFIVLDGYAALLDSNWVIMHHDPLTAHTRAIGVAIPGAHGLPDWGVTYIVIDTTTAEGKASHATATGWHATAASKADFKRFTAYGGARKNGPSDSTVIALDFVLKTDDKDHAVIVTLFKPAPDGYTGEYAPLFDIGLLYADRIQRRN